MEQHFYYSVTIKDQKYWKDVCVVNSTHGPSFPCDWIEYDKSKNIVWLKETEAGDAIGPVGRNIHWNPNRS